jgi:hypothetical protein
MLTTGGKRHYTYIFSLQSPVKGGEPMKKLFIPNKIQSEVEIWNSEDLAQATKEAGYNVLDHLTELTVTDDGTIPVDRFPKVIIYHDRAYGVTKTSWGTDD